MPDGAIRIPIGIGRRETAGQRRHRRHLRPDGAGRPGRGRAAGRRAASTSRWWTCGAWSPSTRTPSSRSVARTRRAVVAHHATRFAGFGAEVAGVINEELFGELDAPVRRVGAQFAPIGSASTLEAAVMPSADTIAEAIRDVGRALIDRVVDPAHTESEGRRSEASQVSTKIYQLPVDKTGWQTGGRFGDGQVHLGLRRRPREADQSLRQGQEEAVGHQRAHRLVPRPGSGEPAPAPRRAGAHLRIADVGQAHRRRARQCPTSHGGLAIQPIPPRRTGCAHLHGEDRADGSRHRFEVLRRHPGHGRGPPRRDLLPLPRQDRDRVPDQRQPQVPARRRAQ